MIHTLLLTLAVAQTTAGWRPVPLVTAQQITAGFAGGEGAQWPRSLAFAPSDGKLAFLGTDVGGIYRSLDAGLTWAPSNVGFSPRGATDIVVDPINSNRVLAVGMSSGPADHHGLWLSENRGASWRSVLPARIAGNNDIRDQIAFDPSSTDKVLGLTRVVYWSRIAADNSAWGMDPEIRPRLYRSNNGGRTWTELRNSVAFGGAWIKVHPTSGAVYAGTPNGFHVSTDRGASFRRTLTGEVTGLDVSRAAPNRVWVTQANRLMVSNDSGQNFVALPGAPPREGQDAFRSLMVSPVDSKHMVVWRESIPNTWNWPRFSSVDGGLTWVEATKDATGAFLPDNTRQGIVAWSPANRNVILGIGGDWVTRSTDAGRTYRYSAQGYNGILVGGRWSFSTSDPNLIFFGSQDYNGAVSTDAGRTWTYLNPSGNGWGGFCYGGFAVTRTFLVVGNAAGWGEPRILKVSTDRGVSWRDTGLPYEGADVGYGFPGRPQIAFAGSLRTQDGGTTWTRMTGCTGVFTHAGNQLFGSSAAGVVRSSDQGATWTLIAPTTEEIADIAVTPTGNRLFAVLGTRAKVWNGTAWNDLPTPEDQFGDRRERTVAVDPSDGNTVYVGRAGNTYASNTSVLRSRDGGVTWTNLTATAPLSPGQLDGGREAICIRVHPATREVYVATSCYGIWRHSAP